IPDVLSPPILHRSFSITALIESRGALANGAIVAQGGDMGGYALYAIDGQPAFCYNYFGLERYCIRSTEKLPRGTATLRFEFSSTGTNSGNGKLLIDGRTVGEGPIDNTEPSFHSINETFDIGRDDGTAVSPDYAGNDVFTGRIAHVSIHIEDPHP